MLENCIVIISRFIFSIKFNDVFFKKSYRAFVKSFGHRMPPIFLVVVWCGVSKFVWSYCIDMFFTSTFFGKLVCFFISFDISICLYFI